MQMVLKYMSKQILTYVLINLLFVRLFLFETPLLKKNVQYQVTVLLIAKRLVKTVPEVELDPVPRLHLRTPDIQTVAGSILWSSKHSFVHIGYAFNTKDHFCSHCLISNNCTVNCKKIECTVLSVALSVAVVGYWRKDVHKSNG